MTKSKDTEFAKLKDLDEAQYQATMLWLDTDKVGCITKDTTLDYITHKLCLQSIDHKKRGSKYISNQIDDVIEILELKMLEIFRQRRTKS